MPRWATFDCYGTLIDWNGGISAVLERVFGADRAPALVERYHELEPELERGDDGFRRYRDVLTLALERLAAEEGMDVARPEELAESLPTWRAFPEVAPALEELRRRGWRLAILSNTDRDYIEASQRTLRVPFDLVLTAEDVGSYKPAPGHWNAFFTESGAGRDEHVHVGASLFHDARPAASLGLRFVWINRLGETADVEVDRELPTAKPLPDTLDELLPR